MEAELRAQKRQERQAEVIKNLGVLGVFMDLEGLHSWQATLSPLEEVVVFAMLCLSFSSS